MHIMLTTSNFTHTPKYNHRILGHAFCMCETYIPFHLLDNLRNFGIQSGY